MGVIPVDVIFSPRESDPELTVKQGLLNAGVREDRLPACWTENGRYVVACSSVHRIVRPSFHAEEPEKRSAMFNNVRPQSIKAIAGTAHEAWAFYKSNLSSRGDSCLRLKTLSGVKYIRFVEAAALV